MAAETHGVTAWGRPVPVLLVALEKGISALAALAGAVLALVLHVRRQTDPLALLFPGEMSEQPRDITVRWIVHHMPHVGTGVMLWLGIGLIFWALLLGAEAVGVWCDLAWGEFLIIVETASFLPIEIYDIARHHGHRGLLSLALNLLMLGYVGTLYRRRMLRRAEAEGVADVEAFGHTTLGRLPSADGYLTGHGAVGVPPGEQERKRARMRETGSDGGRA